MRRAFARLAVAATLFVSGAGGAPTSAQGFRRNEPGNFDYYVLVLSWSPSYCAGNRDRFSTRVDPECEGRPFSFVVHGLWPQYERGFPEYCQVPAPRLARNIVSSMLDLMPSPRLVYHEWDSHGTCSGLGQGAYFDTIRKARSVVKIPPDYLNLTSSLTVAPDDVANAFVAANPGLSHDGLSVACSGRRLSEVRICVSRELKFRDCPEVVQRSCRRDTIQMPPVR